jgi:hypothetical protein
MLAQFWHLFTHSNLLQTDASIARHDYNPKAQRVASVPSGDPAAVAIS